MSNADKILMINCDISDLELGVFTPRRDFDVGYVDELAESIEREGQLKPVIVRMHPTVAERYQVVDGEHRVRAMKKLGLVSVRAEVRALKDEEAYALALNVNLIHGKRLNPIEIAYRLKEHQNKGKSTREIAEIYHKDHSWIVRYLSLIEGTHPKVQEEVVRRRTTPFTATELTQLPQNIQELVIEPIVRDGYTQKETRALVDLVKKNPNEVEAILDMPKEEVLLQAEAEKKHAKVITTSEELEEALRPVETWQKEHTCPNCGKKVKIFWEDGTVEWMN